MILRDLTPQFASETVVAGDGVRQWGACCVLSSGGTPGVPEPVPGVADIASPCPEHVFFRLSPSPPPRPFPQNVAHNVELVSTLLP